MKDIWTRMELERQERAAQADAMRTQLAADMIAAGVARVSVFFSGYGDSGQIDTIDIDMVAGFTLPDWVRQRVEDWTYKFLSGTGIDWYNNDGGQGQVEFDLTTAPAKFTAEVYVNTTVSNLELSVEEGA